MCRALAAGFAALAVAAPASAATLHVVSVAPFTVRGEHFKPWENVLVTLTAGRQRAERHVRAAAGGSFVVVFRAVAVDRCAGYVVRALGSKGSVATLRSPPLRCPPRRSIP